MSIDDIKDPLDPYAHVETKEQMIQILRDELSFCDCGSDGTIPLLVDFLQRVASRTYTLGNRQTNATAGAAVEEFLETAGRPPLVCWFVYLLEHAGLIDHGFNIRDLNISFRGKSMLDALKRTGLAES